MSEVTIIGIDLAKRVFQLHGARADGSVVFRKKLSRSQVLAFFAQQPNCVVAMEACATAHVLQAANGLAPRTMVGCRACGPESLTWLPRLHLPTRWPVASGP